MYMYIWLKFENWLLEIYIYELSSIDVSMYRWPYFSLPFRWSNKPGITIFVPHPFDIEVFCHVVKLSFLNRSMNVLFLFVFQLDLI